MDTRPGDHPDGPEDPEVPAGRDGPVDAAGQDGPEPGPGDQAAEPGGGDQSAEPGGGDQPAEHEPPEGSDPLRFNTWMKRSATGAVLTGISLGLREALELKKNEPAIMIEASGEPEDPDNPIRLHFDPDDPRATVAVIRMPSDAGGTDPTDPEQSNP